MNEVKVKHLYLKAFLIAALTALMIFLPAVIYDNGYFIFVGDYNSQQIPFYKIAHDAIRNGEWGWNWYTDIGANFIGSYTFYLLGSPFFWLTIPFPSDWVPYLMAPLFVLKFGCCALTASIYLRRYLKNDMFVLLGGILYALCGYSIYNIFFNHFHDVMVFFPLLLWSLDELMARGRRGVFALMVAVNALVNYFFFFGEVVFVVIYFFVRIFTKGYQWSWKKVFQIAIESVLGFLMSFVLMLPSILTVTQNYRVHRYLSGFSVWLYSSKERIPAILFSFLFPPELPSKQTLLPDANTKWTSLSAYLPLMGITGAITFTQKKKESWLSVLMKILLLMALVPGLNALYVAFNTAYYARWFYMFSLMLILASVKMLDDGEVKQLSKNTWKILVLTLVLVLILTLTPQVEDGEISRIGLYDEEYWPYYIGIVGTAVLSLIIYSLMLPQLKKNAGLFARRCVIAICIISVLYGNMYIIWGKTRSYDTKNYIISAAIEGEDKITIPDKDEVIRIDADNALINMGMFWKISCMRAFHSIIPGSTIEFYKYIGEKRDVSSKIPEDQYAVRGLLSVHWYFDRIGSSDTFGDPKEENPDTLMPGYSFYGEMNGYNVWENDYYIPMGFTYDQYVLKSELDEVADSNKAACMLRALALDEELESKYQAVLTHYENASAHSYNVESYEEDCLTRAAQTVSNLERTRTGITCTTDFDSPRAVFFSIPYDDGWSLYIDGQEWELDKANIGFMSFIVPAGEHEIEMVYRTPGLKTGILVTFAAAFVLAVYWVLAVMWDRRHPENTALVVDETWETKPVMPEVIDSVNAVSNETPSETEQPANLMPQAGGTPSEAGKPNTETERDMSPKVRK